MDSIIILLFSGILVVGIILMIVIATTRKSPKGINVEEYRSKWLSIVSDATKDEASRHLAILNADKLLDRAMKDSGVHGETMGERLKNSKDKFKHRDAIWFAHKLRNKIAHESDITVSTQDTKRALAAFKTALKDIGAL